MATVSTGDAFSFTAATSDGGAGETLYCMATGKEGPILFIRDTNADSGSLLLWCEQPVPNLLAPVRAAGLSATARETERRCLFGLSESATPSSERFALGAPHFEFYLKAWNLYLSRHVFGMANNDGSNVEVWSDKAMSSFLFEVSSYEAFLTAALSALMSGSGSGADGSSSSEITQYCIYRDLKSTWGV